MTFYISAAAVRQYMQIQGRAVESDGPEFDRAAVELERLAEHRPEGPLPQLIAVRNKGA